MLVKMRNGPTATPDYAAKHLSSALKGGDMEAHASWHRYSPAPSITTLAKGGYRNPILFPGIPHDEGWDEGRTCPGVTHSTLPGRGLLSLGKRKGQQGVSTLQRVRTWLA